MEKIEFIQDNGYFIKEELVKELKIEQCSEKQSWLSKFKNLFKKKKFTITWFDVEREIIEFVNEYKIELSWPYISPNTTLNLNVENTKRFIKKFNKYGRYYYASYDKRYVEERKFIIDEQSIGQLICFGIFNSRIYIKIIK